jgi:hypothetical protein
MFFYAEDFTSPAIFPFDFFPTRSRLSQKFYVEKREVQNACHTQSRWLAALLSHDEKIFTLSLARAYFMLYCKKQTNIIFTWYCHIAREQAIATTCMLYHEDASN